MEILFDLLPLATLVLLVSNSVALHVYIIVFHGLDLCFKLDLRFWFVICDELRWFGTLLSIVFILWFDEVVIIMLSSYHIYLICCIASISTCRGNSVKIFKFHIYVLLVFIQIYKHISRGSSLYSSNLGEFIHIYSEIFKKNE
jgi:hypothetical protein